MPNNGCDTLELIEAHFMHNGNRAGRWLTAGAARKRADSRLAYVLSIAPYAQAPVRGLGDPEEDDDDGTFGARHADL